MYQPWTNQSKKEETHSSLVATSVPCNFPEKGLLVLYEVLLALVKGMELCHKYVLSGGNMTLAYH